MNTQPQSRSDVEALRLADWLDETETDYLEPLDHVAAELRRLHALSAELLKEMRYIASISNGQVSRVAHAAISRAEGTLKME